MPVYVYALTRAEDDAPVAAGAVASDAPVEIVSFGGIGAIVSRIDVSEILPVRRNALQHTRVLEAAMAPRPILPMRFGVIVDSLDKLDAVVSPREPDLRSLLDDLEGCIEVDVKTSWNSALFWKDLVSKKPELGRIGQALQGADQNKTYYERIELGRKVEGEITRRRQEDRQRIVDAMHPFVLKWKELPLANELSVSNHALLIRNTDEEALFAVMQAFEANEAGLIDVRFVSPVPAYNFVSIALDWQAREREVA